jgi:RimJ/RimL family protein N-acetyltransferase
MNEPLVIGKRVRLREMSESDAPAIVEWRNRPEVAHWLIQFEPLTVEAHLRWFAKAGVAGDLLVVFTLHDGTPIGTGSLYGFDRPRTCAEWGRLCNAGKAEHGPAIMEGSYLVHRLGFELLGMKRTFCGCSSENAAALRLNRFLGYVDEGLRRQHLWAAEGYRDMVEFGMLASDFVQRRPEIERLQYLRSSPPNPTAVAHELAKRLAAEHPPSHP